MRAVLGVALPIQRGRGGAPPQGQEDAQAIRHGGVPASPPPPAPVLACVIQVGHDFAVHIPRLRRLIDSLEPFPVYLHGDATVGRSEIARLAADLPGRCTVLARPAADAPDAHHASDWDSVTGEIAGYEAALANAETTHIAVLAATDYPLLSAARIRSTLNANLGVSLADFTARPSLRAHREASTPEPPTAPADLVVTDGLRFKVLSREHARAVVDATSHHPGLIDVWRRNDLPSGTFIPSILSTPSLVPGWAASHISPAPLWGSWDGTSEKVPAWLGLEHYDAIVARHATAGDGLPKLFAHNFSADVQPDLLDEIDRRLRSPAETDAASAEVSAGQAGAGQAGAGQAGAGHAGTEGSHKSHLFGRGLLYVVIWSLQLVVGTVVSPILAYILGPAEFGALAAALAIHQVLNVLALLGIDQALVLQRAEDGDDRAARGLVSVAVAVSLLVTLVVGLTGPLWAGALGFGYFSPLVVATILWTAPAAVVQVVLALLLSQDRLRGFALVSVLAAVGGQVVGIGLVVFVTNDATTYAWGSVVSQTTAMIIGLIATRPRLAGLVDWVTAARAIKLGIPLAMGALAYFVLNAGDRIIIQRILGAEEVGRYQIAYIVGSVVILLLTFTSYAWTPRIAAVRDQDQRWALSADSRDALYRLLVPMVLGVTLGAPILLRIVAPPSFEPNSLLVVVLLVSLSAYPVAASGATGRVLITLRRGKRLAAIAGVAAGFNILLNILLVPPLGIAGAAAATLLAYGLLAALQVWSLPAEPEWRRPPARLVLAIAGGSAAAALSTLLPQTIEWNTVRLVVGLACLPWFLIMLRNARRG